MTGWGSYVAVRYVDGLLAVSPAVAAEAVESGLLLLLLQLQRLDLRLQLLQLVLQVFALLHVLQPASTTAHQQGAELHWLQEAQQPGVFVSPLPLDLHGQPFHVGVLEIQARGVIGEIWCFRGGQRSGRSGVCCYELEDMRMEAELLQLRCNNPGSTYSTNVTESKNSVAVPDMLFWWFPAASVWLSAQRPWPQSDPVSDDPPPSTWNQHRIADMANL